MVYRCETFRDDTEIVVLQSLKVSHLCISILWVTKVEKLDMWTMHAFPNPVTYPDPFIL